MICIKEITTSDDMIKALELIGVIYMHVTARLENWLMDNKSGCLIGDIYDDELKRWPDGQKIKTSKLAPMSVQASPAKEGDVMYTLNSSYLLGKKKGKDQ